MNPIRYLCENAVDFFPYIRVTNDRFSQTYEAAAYILFKDRTTAEDKLDVLGGNYGLSESNTINLYIFSNESFLEEFNPGAGFKEIAASKILRKYGYKARALINEEQRISYLGFAGRIPTYSGAALLPQLAPWKFRDKPLSDWEKKFLVALLESKEDEIERMVQEYITNNKIAQQLDSVKLDNFVKGLLDKKLARYRTQETSILEKIRHFEDELMALRAEYTNVCNVIAGVKFNHHDVEVEDFKNAFISNPNCHLISVQGTCIQFFLTGFLTVFNETHFESMMHNNNSIVFSWRNGLGLSVAQMRSLYEELFVKNRYRINTYGGFTINFETNQVTLKKKQSHDAVTANAIPHPHIYHFGCMGTFYGDYTSAMNANDYMDVLVSAQSEISNINWTDISPVSRFAEDLCINYVDRPCVWDKKAKEFISPKQLAERIKTNEQ